LLQVEREEAARERAAFVEAWAKLPKRLRRLRRSVSASGPSGGPEAAA
jgi:hypothetical protein